MKHIYYLIGIYYMIYEISYILSPQEHVDETKAFMKQYKSAKSKEFKDLPKECQKYIKTKGIRYVVFLIWKITGILTFNWLVFIFSILFNLLLISPISRLLRYNKGYTILQWLNSVIGLLFIVFVIVNSYHLKIDLYDMLMQYINRL